MAPLHPLTLELAARHPEPRPALLGGWNRLLGAPRFPIKSSWIGEIPLVASRALVERLDRKLDDLLAQLRPRLAKRDDAEWPLAPAADVLSADIAIVQAPDSPGRWDLRWVELQAFTSLVSMMYTLHLSATEIWPGLGALSMWSSVPKGQDWLQATRQWMAPNPGSVLLEQSPWSQPTRHDFEAARHWFDLEVVTPDMLRAHSGQLERRRENRQWVSVPHIANRLILHEVPDRERVEHMLASVSLSWNSHPVWYYRINKGALVSLSLPRGERCTTADRWHELDLPAEALVAKPVFGYAGTGIRLRLDAAAMSGLPAPETWIVQPRYAALPLLKARDGAPLYGEIRCVLAIPRSADPPWLVCRLARMTRSTRASAAAWTGAAGEGAVPVYAPPD